MNGQGIESFKSTFVNFRQSMRENAKAKKPTVWENKISPANSPSRVFLSKEIFRNAATMGKQLYDDFISTVLKPDLVKLDVKEEKKLGTSGDSKQKK